MPRYIEGPEGVMQEQPGHTALWNWFGLTRASWITIPRSVAHEMPDEWQEKMAALLEEYDEATTDAPEDIQGTPYVSNREGNRFCKWPEWLLNYRHPNPRYFRWMRRTQPTTEKRG